MDDKQGKADTRDLTVKAPVLDSPSLGQVHNLVADNLVIVPPDDREIREQPEEEEK